MYIAKNSNLKIVYISFFIFLFLNLIENIIHYNIGKYTDEAHGSNGNALHFNMPNADDWVKIISVMFLFALLQGLFTILVNKCI